MGHKNQLAHRKHNALIKKQIEIEETYERLNVESVVLDPSRLLQVVINLLTNAIKFTQYAETKQITVYLGASFDRPTGKHHNVSFIPMKHTRPANSPLTEWGDGEDLYLQIAVADTGRGLSEDEVKVLFQRFSQASPKTYKQYGGSGLGLFISRELCELQGGQIGVSSGDGKTTFTFFVRAKRWVPPLDKRPSLLRFTSASASPMVYHRRGSAVLKEAGAGAEEQLVRIPSISEADDTPRGAVSSIGSVSPRETNKAKDSVKQLHVLIVEVSAENNPPLDIC